MGKKDDSSQNSGVPLTPVSFHILLALAESDLHGYAIKLAIEERTNGEISLGSGTLYQGIHRLENLGYLAEVLRTPPTDARTGRTYRLTPHGRKVLKGELRRYEDMVRFAHQIKLLPGPADT